MQNNKTGGLVPFGKTQIPYTLVDGAVYVAIKAISDAIGLSYSSAQQGVKNDEILASTVLVCNIVAGDGKSREMLCLPLSYLNGWLFSIDANRVNEQAREKLLAYKRECYEVLHNHFFGRQVEQTRSRELWHELQLAYAQEKEMAMELKQSEAGKALTAIRQRIREMETELSTLQASMLGGQLTLLS